MAIAAAKAGKHIWGEKPMSRTIGEGIAMKNAIQKADVKFRINTWFRFKSTFYGSGVTAREVRKAVDGGLIGGGPYEVTLSGVTGFNWRFNWVGKKNLKEQPIPKHFDYDIWLGPAPYQPYHPHRTHGAFRGYWDHDGGGLGDMGQHYLDPIQDILNKDDELPVSIQCDADPQDQDAVGSFRRITHTYSDGTQIILDGANKDKSAVLNEENGFNSCTLINLGEIAHRTNQNLKFDRKKMKFIDNAKANALVHQKDRDKWKLPS